MPKRKASKTHVWMYAVLVPGDAKSVANVIRRGSVRVEHDDKLEVLDAYCQQCRLYYGQIGHQINCDAAEDNENLIGGPTGQRRKRDHSKHNCDAYGCNTDIATLRKAVGAEDPPPPPTAAERPGEPDPGDVDP